MTLRSMGLTLLLTTAVAGCASTPPDGPAGRPPPPGEQGPKPLAAASQLFISPAGEPFRAPPEAPYPVVAWFAGADTNHDSVLNRDEFVADALRFFAVVDSDRSGVIDGFEVSAYENHIAPEIVGGLAPGVARRGPKGLGQDDGGDRPRRPAQAANALQGAALFGLIAEPEPVMASDGNFDRRITRDEATRAAKARFALLDSDQDGLLRLDELPKTPAQTGARPGRGGRFGDGGMRHRDGPGRTSGGPPG